MFILQIIISVLVSLAVCWVYIKRWQKRVRKNLETDIILGKLRTEIGQMLTELNSTAERNIALFENRIQTASSLVDKAAKIADVLQKEQRKMDSVDRIYTELGHSRTFEPDGDSPKPVLPVEPVDFESMTARDKALVLHRRGESLDAISTRLGMSRGEIELIISLHERRH